MKLDFNKQILKVISNIEKKIDSQTQEALKRVVEYATNQAQLGYDKFYYEVPADDPFVFVKHTPISQGSKKTLWSSTISATGNQVLFIEFGAGKYYYTEMETRLYENILGNPRPSSVLDIGEYGHHRGKDELWFYKSQTGRESENAHLVKYNRNGEPIMITHGNRPARALYRAVGMACRRLAGGKLK